MSITFTLAQSLLKRPPQQYKGEEGWWITTKGGKRIFISKKRVKSILNKGDKSKGVPRKTKRRPKKKVKRAKSKTPNQPVIALQNYYSHSRSVLSKEFGKDVPHSELKEIKPVTMHFFVRGLHLHKNGKSVIHVARSEANVLANWHDKRWWDQHWDKKFDTIQEYWKDAIKRNTLFWRRYIEAVNVVTHETAHTFNVTYRSRTVDEKRIEEGLTTYFAHRKTHDVIRKALGLSPHVLSKESVNQNLPSVYYSEVSFIYKVAHIVAPQDPNRYLIELKGMSRQRRIRKLWQDLDNKFGGRPLLVRMWARDHGIFAYRLYVNSLYRKKGYTYNHKYLSALASEDLVRGLAWTTIQSLLKRPLQWFKGLYGWWISTKFGKKIFVVKDYVLKLLGKKTTKTEAGKLAKKVTKEVAKEVKSFKSTKLVLPPSKAFRGLNTGDRKIVNFYLTHFREIAKRHFRNIDRVYIRSYKYQDNVYASIYTPGVYYHTKQELVFAPQMFTHLSEFQSLSTKDKLHWMRSSNDIVAHMWKNYKSALHTFLHEHLHAIDKLSLGIENVSVFDRLMDEASNEALSKLYLTEFFFEANPDLRGHITPARFLKTVSDRFNVYGPMTNFLYMLGRLNDSDAPLNLVYKIRETPFNNRGELVRQVIDDTMRRYNVSFRVNLVDLNDSEGFKKVYKTILGLYKKEFGTFSWNHFFKSAGVLRSAQFDLSRGIFDKFGKDFLKAFSHKIDSFISSGKFEKLMELADKLYKKDLTWLNGKKGWWLRNKKTREPFFLPEDKLQDMLSLGPHNYTVAGSEPESIDKFFKNHMRSVNLDDVIYAFTPSVINKQDGKNVPISVNVSVGEGALVVSLTDPVFDFDNTTDFMGLNLPEVIKEPSFYIERYFYKSKGEWVVDHSNFSIYDEKMQGKGIARALFRKSLYLYDRIGVKKIYVTASYDGSYVWARFGFDFANPKIRKKTLQEFKEYLALEAGLNPSTIHKILANLHTPRDIAGVVYQGKELGKDFLLNYSSGWKGVMDLTDPAQRTYFENYIDYKSYLHILKSIRRKYAKRRKRRCSDTYVLTRGIFGVPMEQAAKKFATMMEKELKAVLTPENIKKIEAFFSKLQERKPDWLNGKKGWWLTNTKTKEPFFLEEDKLLDMLSFGPYEYQVPGDFLDDARKADKFVKENLKPVSIEDILYTFTPPRINQYKGKNVVLNAEVSSDVDTLDVLVSDPIYVSEEGIRNLISPPSFIIERRFRKTSSGLVVKHMQFTIFDSKLQGKGLARAVFRKSLYLYDRIGVKKIYVTTADKGRYVWARFGFDFANDQDRKRILSQFKGYLMQKQELESRVVRHITKDLRTPRDISSFVYEGKEVGKDFFLNYAGSWRGVIDLTDPVQRTYFENYINYRSYLQTLKSIRRKYSKQRKRRFDPTGIMRGAFSFDKLESIFKRILQGKTGWVNGVEVLWFTNKFTKRPFYVPKSEVLDQVTHAENIRFYISGRDSDYLKHYFSNVSLEKIVNAFIPIPVKNVSAHIDIDATQKTVEIDLLDPNQKFRLTRTFAFKDGDLNVYHNFFTLFKGFQGKGLAKSVFRKSLDLYDELGVRKVHVFAGGEGRYVWARYGFAFDEKASKFDVFEKFDEYLKHNLSIEDYAIVKNMYEIDTMQDIAKFVYKGRHLGKGFLLSIPPWHGVLDLQDFSRRLYLENYINYIPPPYRKRYKKVKFNTTIRSLTYSFLSKLLKRPKAILGGEMGWWVTTKAGRKVFIRERRIYEILSKKGISTEGERRAHKLIYSTLKHVHRVLRRSFGKEAHFKVDDIRVGHIGELTHGGTAALYIPNGHRIVIHPIYHDALINFNNIKWWQGLPGYPAFSSVRGYQMYAFRYNTLEWQLYVEGLYSFTHEVAHSTTYTLPNTPPENLLSLRAIEEGLAQYFGQHSLVEALGSTTRIPRRLLHNTDLTDLVPSVYDAETKFLYQLAHLVSPSNPHNFLVQLKLTPFERRLEVLTRSLERVLGYKVSIKSYREYIHYRGIVQDLYKARGYKYNKYAL